MTPLTGSLTASGGVGALVQIYDATAGKTLLPAYDGNGNVAAMVNADSGALEAIYEYDPFGNLLRKEGGYAADNPFRFSTKYTDKESDLVYYGHRYYSPDLGRFINRDPIEEQGGVNLYSFVRNNAVNGWDYLGMVAWVYAIPIFRVDPHDPDEPGVKTPPGFDSSQTSVWSGMTNGDRLGQIFMGDRGAMARDMTTRRAESLGGTVIGTDKKGNLVVAFPSSSERYDALGALSGTSGEDRLVGLGSYAGGDPNAVSSYELKYFDTGFGEMKFLGFGDGGEPANGVTSTPNNSRTPPSTLSQLGDIASLGSGGPAAVIGLTNIITNNWTRNSYNQVPSTQTVQDTWVLQGPSQSVWHQVGPGNENNQKYMSPDGHNEVVYSPGGSVVTDQVNMGTYNYGTNFVTHTLLDVVPYWLFGNGPNPPQTVWQRIWAQPPTSPPPPPPPPPPSSTGPKGPG